jgi:hypothetical protein
MERAVAQQVPLMIMIRTEDEMNRNVGESQPLIQFSSWNVESGELLQPLLAALNSNGHGDATLRHGKQRAPLARSTLPAYVATQVCSW